MKDELFGELQYDYLWEGKVIIKLYGLEYNINLNIDGEEDEMISEIQRDSFVQYFKNEDDISKQIEKAVFEYYKSIYMFKREKNDKNILKKIPKVTNSEEMVNLIKPINFGIPETDNEREIDILFNCTWDFDLGMGIRIVNEKVVKIGVQNDVL